MRDLQRNPLNILLVDDHRLVADAMALMLKDLADNVSVTVCHTSQRALTLLDEGNGFDLILSDLYMPGIDGLGFLHGLRSRNISAPIVIVSSTENPRMANAALKQGANGFIQKSLPGKEMLAALKKIISGDTYYPVGFGSSGFDSVKGSDMGLPDNLGSDSASLHEKEQKLGPRQIEVLQLMAAGNSNKQIAQLLEISEATVKYHTSLLFKALSVHNRTSCIREGQRLNLISAVSNFSDQS